MNIVTTFANPAEFLKAKALLERGRTPFRVLSPEPGYATIGTPAIARISGDLAELFPYINSVRSDGFFNKNGPTFSFMDRYRMITVNASRIAMAKVDDIVDVWRVLEDLRLMFNECRLNRSSIEPS